jgi:hypothetical protein
MVGTIRFYFIDLGPFIGSPVQPRNKIKAIRNKNQAIRNENQAGRNEIKISAGLDPPLGMSIIQ